MTDRMQVIAAGGVATGVIIFAVTGALWPFIPIAGAIAVGGIAAKALEEDKKGDKPKPPPKPRKKK